MPIRCEVLLHEGVYHLGVAQNLIARVTQALAFPFTQVPFEFRVLEPQPFLWRFFSPMKWVWVKNRPCFPFRGSILVLPGVSMALYKWVNDPNIL